jgi:hypothetical protein
MKFILANTAALLACGVTMADEVKPQECCPNAFKYNFTTEVSLYDFADGDITAFTPKFTYAASDKLTVGASLPLYNDNNTSFSPQEFAWQLNDGISGVSGTGLGDLDLFFTYNLFDGKCCFLKTDKASIDITGGIKAPLDGAYSSSDPVLYVGGSADLTWGAFTLAQTVSYSFVTDYTYSPLFGGFVNSDLYGGVTTVSYKANDKLTVSVNANQQYFGSDNFGTNYAFLLGPAVAWDLNKNTTLKVAIDFPIAYDAQSADLNTVFTAGIGFEF